MQLIQPHLKNFICWCSWCRNMIFLALAYLRPQVLNHSSTLITNLHIQCLQYSKDLSCFKLLIWYFESSILCCYETFVIFQIYNACEAERRLVLILIPYGQVMVETRSSKRILGSETKAGAQDPWCKIRNAEGNFEDFETVTIRHRPAKTIWLICHLRPLPTICKNGK